MAKAEYVEFILSPYPAQRGFSSYRGADGNIKTYCEEYDKKGSPKIKNINFRPNQRILRVSKSEKDLNGIYLWEFLRDSPHCKDSPLAKNRTDAYMRMYDPHQEAKVLVDKEMRNYKAMQQALEMDLETLGRMANLAGCFDVDVEIQRKAVVQYAKFHPEEFLKQLKSKDMPLESLIRIAKKSGLIKVDKLQWYFTATPSSEPMLIGSGSAAKVIDYLRDNPDVKNAIQEQVNAYASSKSES